MLDYILLFLTVFGGGLVYFLFGRANTKVLKLVLSFSGAYLFGITITHLMPEVFESSVNKIGVYVLLGFIFQIILEFFSEGIEHGHIHVHQQHTHAFPFSMLLSLSIHAFFEGVPLSNSQEQRSLMMGIIMHHVPVAFALMSMLSQSGVGKKNCLIALLLFAAMTPVGGLTGVYLGNVMSGPWFDIMMAVVIGMFLHISTTILFESDSDHRFNLYKLLIILAGASLSILV